MVFLGIMVLQYMVVEYGGTLFRTSGLDGKQHAYCILFGMSTLIPCFILKILPTNFGSFLTSRIHLSDGSNEEEDGSNKNKLYNLFRSHVNPKATANAVESIR
jgi:hypothetical protein